MARMIKYSEEAQRALCEEFLRALRGKPPQETDVLFRKKADKVDRRAKITFSEKAWVKMQELIRVSKKEVGWHGVVWRLVQDEYYVNDILIYPQIVSGVHFTTDQAEYEKWLCTLPDEEFKHLRLHGHSHVDMPVSPSGRDDVQWNALLERVPADGFQVFMIWNKRGECTCKVYDFQQNVAFETEDCDVSIDEGEYGLAAFTKEAKAIVKEAALYNNYSSVTPVKSSISHARFNPKAKKPIPERWR